MGEFTYEFDIHGKKLVNGCNLCPTETNKNGSEWLFAINNKYEDESIDSERIGKWEIFLPKNSANAAWDTLKDAVANGKLWRSKVSTTDPEKPEDAHTIVIYSKDFTDVEDVVDVLDYLESSGIKPPNANIKYSKDKQTSANADSRENERLWIYSSNLIRSAGSSIHDTYEYDIHKKEIITDCKLYPTETLNTDFLSLHARNNKYPADSIDPDKEGMWMLFLPSDMINAAWDKIKKAVTDGELYHSLVSTVDPERPCPRHAIMIMSKDYADMDDVTHVLDYLENSEIKPPGVIMKYKRSGTGIYMGGRARSWLYSSDTIRSVGKNIGDTYEFDVHAKELVTDCNLNPAQANGSCSWLYARNNKYPEKTVDPEKVGKWILFLPKNRVNAAWDQVKLGVGNGELWCAKVSTFCRKNDSFGHSHTLMIYTKDYSDVQDVIQVLDYLESCEIKPPNVNISYKTEEETHVGYRAGVYHAGGHRSMYFSNTVRNVWMRTSEAVRSSDSAPHPGGPIHDTYVFDVHKKETVTNCSSYPTEIRGKPLWLCAKNNKYPEVTVDPKKVGYWEIYLREDRINAAWDKIKTAIASGELWSAKVSTFKRKNYPVGDSYTVKIHTKDCTDLKDVVNVLSFLESSAIKPPNAIIMYRLDDQTRKGYQEGRQKALYFSNTVRNEFKMDLPWR